ncbi:MAG: TetR/AcrR family transcriptional regulator [Candidatus Saccharibacteria bacterium]|nr:TetR/AcrR family transcriptional regulator [Candidatus Saccharibacteria bacterium]
MNKSTYSRATAKKRRKIQEAFAELVAERGSMQNVTVTDLAERAEITRGTFYNYYDNIHQIAAELQSEIEKQLFSPYDNLDSLEAIEAYIDDVFEFFKSQEDIYSELLTSASSAEFLNQLEDSICERVFAVLHKYGITDKTVETELLFTTHGALSIVRKYYRDEIDLSLDDIRDYLKAKIAWMFREFVAE